MGVFLAVNILPVHLFGLLIFVDYMWLADAMSDSTRIVWLDYLWGFTVSFTTLYTLNVGRLLMTLVFGVGPDFLDWESTIYAHVFLGFWKGIKRATTSLWDNYHARTWT